MYNRGIRHSGGVQSLALQCTEHATEVLARPSAGVVVELPAQRPLLPEGGDTEHAPSQVQIDEVLSRIEDVVGNTGSNGGMDDPDATPIPESQA